MFVSDFPSVFCFSHARFSTKMENALRESFGVLRSAGKPASTLFAMWREAEGKSINLNMAMEENCVLQCFFRD